MTETLARSVQIGAVGGTIIAGFRKCVDTLHGDVFFKGMKFDVCAKDPKFILGPVVGALIVGKALQGGKTVAQLKDVTLRREPLKKRDQATRGAAAALTLGSGCSLGPEGPCVELGAATGQWAASQGGKPNALAVADRTATTRRRSPSSRVPSSCRCGSAAAGSASDGTKKMSKLLGLRASA